ncbi:MAG: pirin family protein [Burkholderiales bacterium]|nr:pirin family protein [Burkholderiales bacterium]
MDSSKPRQVEHLIAGTPTSDGAGVKLTRVLTQQLQQRLDPYLMLDAFGRDQPDDYIAGFPDHPRRGFETITYMIAGQPLREPIVQYGPFVMNTTEQIHQAVAGFRAGRLA